MSTSTEHDPTERGARRGPSRLRTLLAAATATVVGAGLALGGAAGAQAAEGSDWGTFAGTGPGGAVTGTVTLAGAFPTTTFTSTSSSVATPGGTSTFQSAGTPPGELYGTSRGVGNYVSLRPASGGVGPAGASVTTYAFEGGSPASGWSFVLGDIDADQVTVTATGTDGAPVDVADMGFQGTYNSCAAVGGPSCTDTDQPVWDEATATLRGNVTDTNGASGWFSPSVPLATLSLRFETLSGSPIYQTWFATRTFALAGTATLDGAPLPGATVTVADAGGRTVATLTTGPDGTYAVPALVATDGYQVTVTPPADLDLGAVTLAADLAAADATGIDAAFVTPEPVATAVGTVVDQDGEPVADLDLAVVTDEDVPAPVADAVTAEDGTFVVEDLPLATDLVLVTDGDPATEVPFTTPAEPDAVDLGTVTVQVAPGPEPTVTVVGTVVDQDAAPVADVDLAVVTDDATPVLVGEAVTGDDGTFSVADLPLGADLVLAVDGDPVTLVPFTTPAAAGTVDLGQVVVPRAAPPVVTPPDPGQPGPVPAPQPAPVAPAPVAPAGRPGALAYTGAESTLPLGLAATLLLAGAALSTTAAVRRRAR